jgi:2-phosphoglycerate kinase
VGVRAMIDRAVAENSNLILDGVSIVPGMVGTARYATQAEVIFLVVATLDAGAFRSRFAARGRDARARPTHHYLENLDAILHIRSASWSSPISTLDLSSRSFDRSVSSIPQRPDAAPKG